MWISWVLVGLTMGACVVQALDLGGAAARTAARNRARGGSGWRRRAGGRVYVVRPTTTRGVRLAAAVAFVCCAALVTAHV